MTVYNLGSINADYFYQVPHIPAPGETLAATDMSRGLGGKGANQSVALARAGAKVRHIGAVGGDGAWMLDRLVALGVDVEKVTRIDGASGHAIITVAADGENAITLFTGANHRISADHIKTKLKDISANDWLVLQNETNGQDVAISLARAVGAKVVYSAAPFDAKATSEILDQIDILAVNETEANQLTKALTLVKLTDLPVPAVLMTKGARGATYFDLKNQTQYFADAFKVKPVDTTGAGDTFLGFFVGRLDAGDSVQTALETASKAAALKVTQPGTADAIPTLAEVLAFTVS